VAPVLASVPVAVVRNSLLSSAAADVVLLKS